MRLTVVAACFLRRASPFTHAPLEVFAIVRVLASNTSLGCRAHRKTVSAIRAIIVSLSCGAADPRSTSSQRWQQADFHNQSLGESESLARLTLCPVLQRPAKVTRLCSNFPAIITGK
jgi:hypothetical protein